MNKGVAGVVKANRSIYGSGFISPSEVSMSFDIPEEISLSQTLSNLEFASYTFRVKGVNAFDSSNNSVNVNFNIGSRSVEKDVFSIENLEPSKKIARLTILAEPKNRQGSDGTAEQAAIDAAVANTVAKQFTRPMTLKFPPNNNFYMSKESMKQLATSGQSLMLQGNIYGTVKAAFPISGFDLSDEIGRINSNTVKLNFVYPTVTFNKNSLALGDSATQIVASNIVASQENANTLFIGDSAMPQALQSYTDAGGQEFLFIGWNTRQDGTGQSFTSTSDVKSDMIVYAMWQQRPMPTASPSPTPTATPTASPLPTPIISFTGTSTALPVPTPKPNPPKTGDAISMVAIGALISLSVSGLVFAGKKKKK